MELDSKMAAAVAAVMAYIKSEEEAAALQAASTPRPEAPAPAPPLRVWGLNGRQTMMQMRNLMQMKAFHGTRWR